MCCGELINSQEKDVGTHPCSLSFFYQTEDEDKDSSSKEDRREEDDKDKTKVSPLHVFSSLSS